MLKSLCQSSKNSHFEFDFLNNLSEKNVEWDAILPENHHLKSKNLAIYENNASTENVYAIVYENKQVIGLIYAQKISLSAKDVNFSMLKLAGWGCIFKTILSENCALKLLVCGNLFRNGFQGFYFKENHGEQVVMTALNDYILNQNEIAGVLIKDCKSKIEFDKFETGNFKKLEDDFVMSMEIKSNWNNLETYTSELSKKYRKRLQKIKEASKDLIFRQLNPEELVLYKDKMYALYSQIYQKQDINLGKLLPDYFIKMQEILGDQFKVMGVFFEEKLIAFSSHIDEEQHRSEIHYIGIDYAYNERFNIYFNLLYWGLEMAIEGQKTVLDLGRFAQVAKASLGAKPVYMQNYVFLKKPIVKWGFGFFFDRFYAKLEKDLSFRNPFSNKAVG
jgi:hypothetical protein